MSAERIDFYLLDSPDIAQIFVFTCRLTEKAYNHGLHIHIQTENSKDTTELDQLLWTFSQQSFIPHQQTAEPEELCAVTLNHAWDPQNSGLLINLSLKIPDYYHQFNRIAEVVGSNPEHIQAGRDHFRFYCDNAVRPTHHKVS